jgi:hypothetical protein
MAMTRGVQHEASAESLRRPSAGRLAEKPADAIAMKHARMQHGCCSTGVRASFFATGANV